MIGLSWNYQGLGHPRAVSLLADLITAKKPDFCFLIKIFVTKRRMEVIKKKIGFDYVFAVECVGIRRSCISVDERVSTTGHIVFSQPH